jgi:hypothetical protein
VNSQIAAETIEIKQLETTEAGRGGQPDRNAVSDGL